MGASITFPAVGKFQTCAGEINGIWYTWSEIDGIALKRFPHSSMDEALEVYEANRELFKGINQATATTIESALEENRLRLVAQDRQERELLARRVAR